MVIKKLLNEELRPCQVKIKLIKINLLKGKSSIHVLMIVMIKTVKQTITVRKSGNPQNSCSNYRLNNNCNNNK